MLSVLGCIDKMLKKDNMTNIDRKVLKNLVTKSEFDNIVKPAKEALNQTAEGLVDFQTITEIDDKDQIQERQ